ncbi:hypothetical protein HPB49_013839 [Dermacentor silvarum]|uniref:Uncharacterized protein n=1 Tax=Dermacentor silvarum TaxID=543639 RepID=A0ACB8CF88_DERSI|nr:hypothetical protein HPB49_013839 [Dermacentor silvarum]
MTTTKNVTKFQSKSVEYLDADREHVPMTRKRFGQRVCRDTCPDLSVWSGADVVTWSNSFEDLGSDHTILCVTMGENESEEDVCRKARIVGWDRFHKNRERDKNVGPLEDSSEWCSELLADVEKATDEIEWTDWRQESPKKEETDPADLGTTTLPNPENSVALNQPHLPINALKLIVRPRGGLLLSKISTYQLLEAICMAARFTKDAVRHQDVIQANLIQNTFAYCTPDVQRTEQVKRLKVITIDNKKYEVSVYCAPDDSSGRGVIRGVHLRLDRDTIQPELQDNRNPAIVNFRRLGNTTAVLITFAQPQVPTWVYFCNSRHRCNLFRKKYEVCYHCGELGHRADVCASPTTKCRGCGLYIPPNDYTCKPTCRLCGKEHFTGDSHCKKIYRIPYTVKRQQWENCRQAEANILKAQEPAKQVTLQHTSLWDRHRSGSRQRQPRDRSSSFPWLESTTHRGRSRTPSRSRHGAPALIQQPRASSPPPRQPPGPPPSPPVQQEHQLPVSTQEGTPSTPYTHNVIVELTAVIQQLILRVDALEKRTASNTPSPPTPQVPPTTVPMKITPSRRPTHKRKAPADNDPPAENWQARLDRLEQKYELKSSSHQSSRSTYRTFSPHNRLTDRPKN